MGFSLQDAAALVLNANDAPEFQTADLGQSRRSLVVLKELRAVVVYERTKPGADPAYRWALEGFHPTPEGFAGEYGGWRAAATAFLPRYGRMPRAAGELRWDDPSEDPRLLAVVEFVEEGRRATPVEPISEIDLAGVRLGRQVVLFHTGLTATRSAVFFDCGGEGTLRFLIAGLAPGFWEIWRNGFLAHPQEAVPRAVLRFEGPPGNYFLRLC